MTARDHERVAFGDWVTISQRDWGALSHPNIQVVSPNSRDTGFNGENVGHR